MKRKLSPKKERFLRFVKGFIKQYDRPPTFFEIMNGLGFSSLGTVNWYVRELERDGYLIRSGFNAKRALYVSEDKDEGNYRLPLLGLISAGKPLESIEDREYIEVPLSYVHPDNFVLRVKGDSMVEDNIQDGDFIIVRKRATAYPGQTVVAFINGEATLKRYYPSKDGVELHPRNPAYSIIKVAPEDDFRIIGVVLFVFRKYK